MDNSLRFKSPEVDIDKDNPWSDDKLDRKKCADALTNFIADQHDSLVLSLNGGWGSGKSFMLKRWQADLEIKSFSAIYFNAWEDDYYNDPLIAIIGQLKEYMGHEWDSVAKYAAPIIKAGANILAKALTGGIVGFNGETAQSVFDEYDEAKENIQKLKTGLVTAIQKAIPDNNKLPLIFIIDELDRCRPTFAIELLERIKHIFNIPDIVFVLGIDREQLGHSIKCVYGQDMDVEGYLHRFIDMNFTLPDTDQTMFCIHLFKHWGIEDFFCSKGKKHQFHLDEFQSFKNTFQQLCFGLKLSLREIEHAIRIFAFAAKNVIDNHYMYPVLLSWLILLKMKNGKLYKELSSGKCFSFKALDYIFDQIQEDKWADRVFSILEAQVYLTDDFSDWDRRSNKSIVSQQLHLLAEGKPLTPPICLSKRTMRINLEEVNKLLSYCKDIQQNSAFRGGEIEKGTLGYLTEKIELSSLLLKVP